MTASSVLRLLGSDREAGSCKELISLCKRLREWKIQQARTLVHKTGQPPSSEGSDCSTCSARQIAACNDAWSHALKFCACIGTDATSRPKAAKPLKNGVMKELLCFELKLNLVIAGQQAKIVECFA